MTPEGRVFHAGTYSPPRPAAGHAVVPAGPRRGRGGVGRPPRRCGGVRGGPRRRAPRGDGRRAAGLARHAGGARPGGRRARRVRGPAARRVRRCPEVPGRARCCSRCWRSVGHRCSTRSDARRAHGIAERALAAMRDSGLRDPVEGGFFRYAVRRDWTEPHYERMLTDNALLLRAVRRARRPRRRPPASSRSSETCCDGRAGRSAPRRTRRASVDGVGSEGGYYALDAAARAGQPAPGRRREGAHRLERPRDRRAGRRGCPTRRAGVDRARGRGGGGGARDAPARRRAAAREPRRPLLRRRRDARGPRRARRRPARARPRGRSPGPRAGRSGARRRLPPTTAVLGRARRPIQCSPRSGCRAAPTRARVRRPPGRPRSRRRRGSCTS